MSGVVRLLGLGREKLTSAKAVGLGSWVSMSESSDRESHEPPAFGGEDTESEEPSQYVCSEDESSQTEGVVEVLEAITDRVLALPHIPEVGSSNQASPSGSVGVAVASASEGVDIQVGVPLVRRNVLTEVKLAELRTEYSVPPYVGLRLPTAVDVVRYPSEGSMMLAKLGYAPGQYNPNSWILLHEAKQRLLYWSQANCRKAKQRLLYWSQAFHSEVLEEQYLTFGAGSVKWGSISKEQEDEVERVRSLLSETERECKNLVTKKNLFESGLLQGMAGIIKESMKVAVDLDDAEMA
ncbi:unnamed protein product [Prunus armeniaca]